MSEIRDSDRILSKDLPEIPEQEPEDKQTNLFGRLKSGLSKTRGKLISGLKQSLIGEAEIDEDILDEVEERLLSSDMGVATGRKILQILEAEIESGRLKTKSDIFSHIRKIIETVLDKERPEINPPGGEPLVLLFIGVNGVGKTTTIGKLAAQFAKRNKKVLIAAGDTFRAAAIEQLKEWAQRAGVDIMAKAQNSDPSATMFEATKKAKEENYDLLLCDTSGRLHTKKNLMDELAKMKRVMKKNIPDSPHHTLLVLDANTGQNALSQTKDFSEIIGIDGLVLTKLDGTAKGGVLIGIVNEFELPVYYIGVGEKIDDLQEFNGKLISESLFAE